MPVAVGRSSHLFVTGELAEALIHEIAFTRYMPGQGVFQITPHFKIDMTQAI